MLLAELVVVIVKALGSLVETVEVKVPPVESVPVVITGAPIMPEVATPRRPLMADSRDWMFDWYWVGMALKNAGGVDAANAELIID